MAFNQKIADPNSIHTKPYLEPKMITLQYLNRSKVLLVLRNHARGGSKNITNTEVKCQKSQLHNKKVSTKTWLLKRDGSVRLIVTLKHGGGGSWFGFVLEENCSNSVKHELICSAGHCRTKELWWRHWLSCCLWGFEQECVSGQIHNPTSRHQQNLKEKNQACPTDTYLFRYQWVIIFFFLQCQTFLF